MDPEQCFELEFVETVLDEADWAPTQSDPLNSPPCKRKKDAHDRRLDEELAAVEQGRDNSPQFHQSSGVSQLWCQALLDMLRHQEFNIKDVLSTSATHVTQHRTGHLDYPAVQLRPTVAQMSRCTGL